jgi:L-alanine-DL-glutamate epimerase-like enolase superfamily enzyme
MPAKDIKVTGCRLFFCPIATRVPLKFGPELTTSVVCARTKISVAGAAAGRETHGWGETPLSVAWVWPGSLSYEYRLGRLQDFCLRLAGAWNRCAYRGHPMEIGRQFIDNELKELWKDFNRECGKENEMPWLAALVCNSLFDIALHDAYGMYHGISSWDIYTPGFMNRDLSWYYGREFEKVFAGKYPADYLVPRGALKNDIVAWHLVGAKDVVREEELTGEEPDDGYPVKLRDWIARDGLSCLKVKLCGVDADWDFSRLVAVGKLALETGVEWLSTDFNCTVKDPRYVCEILDRLMAEYPAIYKLILYVEQPFPYDIESYPIDVRAVSARKPLFMDESAHDWSFVRIGRELGWTGVALKTCKTVTGAILSLAWAKEFSFTLMVQDLTNPMFAQIPHVGLGAHAGTIMGVESNGMQFYPEASKDEARIHPGLYARAGGRLRLDSLGNEGFGYRAQEIFKAAGENGGAKWQEARV